MPKTGITESGVPMELSLIFLSVSGRCVYVLLVVVFVAWLAYVTDFVFPNSRFYVCTRRNSR